MQFPSSSQQFLGRIGHILRKPVAFGLVMVVLCLLNEGSRIDQAGASPAARPFSPNSFWNAPLPASTPTDPRSSLWVANIKRQITQYYGTVNINTTSYSAPVYTVAAGTPTVAFKFNNCQGKSYVDTGLMQQLAAVPVPANAVPSAGTDQEMIVWQPSTDTVWETWGTQHRSDGWYACWGGRIANASQSNGVFPQYYGVAASGLALLGGMMRIDELQAGQINHALDMSLVETKQYSHSWPANRDDGWINNANAIAEGQRFRLDPTINVDALNISPMAKMMAKAMQKYGLVIRDKSGAVNFYGENPLPMVNAGQGNPYTAIFGGKQPYEVLQGFPWERLQALPFDYGRNGVQEAGTPNVGLTPSDSGYRVATASGDVRGFGASRAYGTPNTKDTVALSSTTTRMGYWTATASGAVNAFGDAVGLGSMAGKKLNAPIVGMATRPTDNGYYLLGKDGGIFSFGDAPFYGSTGGMKLNQPVVGMAPAPGGDGYWFVAADGGVFAYGPGANFFGSMGGQHLNRPIVGMAATPTGRGYWLVASDGGVFAFGDASFYGSTGSITLNKPIVGVAGTPTGAGYRFIASDGGVFNYGDARFEGSLASAGVGTVVALTN